MSTHLPPIRIAVFDDHPMIISGIVALLNSTDHFEVVATSKTLVELSELLWTHQVDVLVADVIAPDTEGLKLFRHVRKAHSDVEIIAYTSLNNAMLIKSLLSLGVKGFVNKRQPEDKLIEAVEIVSQHELYVPSQFNQFAEHLRKEKFLVDLSKREQEILLLIVDGLLSKEIAAELGIAINTVDNHRTSLFRKFGVQNLGELIREANNLGFITS